MPNLSTNNRNQIYKYTPYIRSLFKNDNNPIEIDGMRVKSIVIDYNYDKFNFPLIYATLALDREDADKLAQNQQAGTLLFTLKRYIENSDMPKIQTDYINEECVYFIPNNVVRWDESRFKKDDEDDIDPEGSIVTIGMIALKHINQNKVSINGVLKGTPSSIVFYSLNKHKNVLMEAFTNNPKEESVIIPPIASTSKLIKYFDGLYTFYDTRYRFFMDFDITYLISSSGKGIKRSGELINTIKIILHNTYNEESLEGIMEDASNGMYIVHASGKTSSVNDSNFIEKTTSAIQGISTTGYGTKVVIPQPEGSLIKQNTDPIRLPNGNTNLLKNIQSSTIDGSTILNISKNKVDASIFTINKYYHIDTSEVFGDAYTGTYLLAGKKEIYAQEDTGLIPIVLLTFTKINHTGK